MTTQELYAPTLALQVGDYHLNTGFSLELYASKDSYFDWMKLRFHERFTETLQLAPKAAVTLSVGYGESLQEVFCGYLAKGYGKAAASEELLCKDAMILLEGARISGSFQDSTPQELISLCLGRAGIAKSKLATTRYPRHRQLTLPEMSTLQAIRAIMAAWGISERFFFSDGVFHWGTQPEQATVYHFDYGVNIISLARHAGLWELQTIALPFLRHSQRISIAHPKISGSFVITKLLLRSSEEGFLRTILYFEG